MAPLATPPLASVGGGVLAYGGLSVSRRCGPDVSRRGGADEDFRGALAGVRYVSTYERRFQ